MTAGNHEGAGMDHDTFIGIVARSGGLEPDRARRAAAVVLETLALRVGEGPIEELRPHVPPDLHDAVALGVLRGHGRAHGMTVGEFLDEIARRNGDATREEAAARARAVLTALRDAAGDRAFLHLAEQLPKDYVPLLDPVPGGPVLTGARSPGGTVPKPGPPEPPREYFGAGAPSPGETVPAPGPLEPPREFTGPLSGGEFIGRVAERAHLDRDRAAVCTEAILEALALRVTEDQIAELKPFVPTSLHTALDRGVLRGQGQARRMALEYFLDEVAVQEGPDITAEEAAAHARAALAVLREITGAREFRDALEQLPKEYEAIVPHLSIAGLRAT